MPILNISVKNKMASADNTIIVCNNTDYVVHFDFDSEWSQFETKIMRVTFQDGNYYEVEFQGVNCSLPLVSDVRNFCIGVYAGNLHSTTPVIINTKKSILGNSTGEQIIPINELYRQLLEESWG